MYEIDSLFERDYRCVTSVVKYSNCVVDFGPGKSIHYPELNACFLKENFNCNAIHFGYAIPVLIIPIDENPDFVELVFDCTQDLDPLVAGYILQNHPEFNSIRSGVDPFKKNIEDDCIDEVKNNFKDFTDLLYQQNVREGKIEKGIEGNRWDPMATTAKHDHKRVGSAVDFTGSNLNSPGVTTWPLKNKTIGQDPIKNKKDSVKTLPKSSDEFLSEVQREEEKLINALKSGVIITEEESSLSSDKEKLVDDVDSSSVTVTSPNKMVDVNFVKNRNFSNATTTNGGSNKKISSDKTVSGAKKKFESVNKKLQKEDNDDDVVVVTWKNKNSKKWMTDNNNSSEKNKNNLKGRNNNNNNNGGGGVVTENVPHPELTIQQKQHIRQVGSTNNPVRPFLTRGSVAERVLIFEKCPTELLLDKRRNISSGTSWRSELQTRTQTFTKEKENQRPIPQSPPPHTTLQRQAKANKNVFIPRFYFPQGKPQNQQQIDTILQKLSTDFRNFPLGQVPQDKFQIIVKTCECPLYWKVPLFKAAGGEKLGYVDAHTFLDYWKQLVSTCHDAESKFLKILSRNETRNFLLPEDFICLIQDVVDTHPGLIFLKEANEFHSRYIHTVIARIFYCVNRSWSGRITLPELRRSNLLQIISLLEEEEDINQITQYFSYEHFYVIYCKFWELDRDHDLFIDRQDLTRHNDHALSSRMIDRIFSGAVTRGCAKTTTQDKMSYTEFVWFLLSEEDKQHPTAIEYWFRCMDLDGDGYLSMYELEYFYEEQLQRMELLGIATLPFEDCLCQMLDMIHPQTEGKISLSDLKKCKMVTIFFDTFFNLEKYLDHEQRDPFASQRDHEAEGEMSDWDRYAAEEYEILVAEEEGNDHGDELSYDSDGTSSDGGGGGGGGVPPPPTLEKLIKTFEEVEKIKISYPDNLNEKKKNLISVVNSEVSLAKIFETDFETNENGNMRVKIPNTGNGNFETVKKKTHINNNNNNNTFINAWEPSSKIKLKNYENRNRKNSELDREMASA
ncbi:conserved hypothetical protein [Pediculus humanus corporis]|uniref:EF-hand domain-containing protein n=1 Tax=Pediculus humanus subsp. corporis TaxID=121224 RepID=E0VFV4_PEDHC|nr:uncharacterized protein Phum_PHUM168120 [Pediculus humanus corporis]EEB12260.1 conserved hypothetical protein [Pediculus humanus corporis]